MRKLVSLLLNRRVLCALGLAAAAALVWYVGPLIAIAGWHPLEGEATRRLVIALVVGIVVARALWKLARAAQSNKALMDGLLKPAPGPRVAAPKAGAEELALLGKRFEEAVGVLKQARLGGSRSALAALGAKTYVYELPWYVIIGAPGSGKTTALVNSGLQFPLADRLGREAVRGIGGTRNCDWWFTDEAVLIDTAGRYTTHESDRDADAAAWAGFLELLKKHRPRRPINGVLVTVSVADLVGMSAPERESHAKTLRARVQELHERLGIRFPIYVLVTKVDLLAGCMEFFGEYGKDERAQVWGVTFPYAGADVEKPGIATLDRELAALAKRLNERLVDRLQAERDRERRMALYVFPQQWSTLRETLADFLQQVFAPSRFEAQPLVRGVYFTSGTQEGTPIDRVMGGLGRALGLSARMLPPARASGKSFFLTRLLREVVFGEAGLAGANLRWERRRALLQWGATAAAAAVTCVVICAWGISYSRNKAYVAEVKANVDTVAAEVEKLQGAAGNDVVRLLPVLASVRELSSTSAARADGVPWSMGFGLYQGDKLGAATRNAYERLLLDAFLPRVAAGIEAQLARSRDRNREAVYEALKAYIMLHDTRHFDAAALQAFITTDWEASLPRDVTNEQRRELVTHLERLLAAGEVVAPIPPDAQLLAAVRGQIAQVPLPQRVYNRLKRLGVGVDLPAFTVAKAGGPAAPLVFTRASGQPLTSGVPGLYSYDGYHKTFGPAADRVARQFAEEETWVLGVRAEGASLTDPPGKSRLIEDVRRLYLEDYAQDWEAFVRDIHVIRGGDLVKSLEIARTLSAPDSPLVSLTSAIVREVTLSQLPDREKTLADKTAERLQGAKEDLQKLLHQAGVGAQAQPAGSLEAQIVDSRFDSLRHMVRSAGPGQPAPIHGTIALLNELYTALTAAHQALRTGQAPPPSDVPNKIRAEAGRVPEPIRGLLLSLSSESAREQQREIRVILGQQLSGQVSEFCTKAIGGRYPFQRGSALDVTQEDFGRLFAPGGMLDEFFQKNLAGHVDTGTRPWSFRKVGDAARGELSTALPQFQRAAAIREVFFRSGGRAPDLRLEFRPVEMDATITHFILDVDGQLVRYSHGPQVPATVTWPGPKGSQQVRLQLAPPSPGGASGQVFDGPWALFRMLDRVRIEPTRQPEKFLVTFDVEGRKARFEVFTSSVQNPFRLSELGEFQCPSRL